MLLCFAGSQVCEARWLAHAGNIEVVGDRDGSIIIERHEFRAEVGVRHFAVLDFLARTHLVLIRYGVSSRQDFPDQFIGVSVVGEKFIQRSYQLVMGALYVLRHVAVDAVRGEMVCHAFGIAVIPGVKIACYKFCHAHGQTRRQSFRRASYRRVATDVIQDCIALDGKVDLLRHAEPTVAVRNASLAGCSSNRTRINYRAAGLRLPGRVPRTVFVSAYIWLPGCTGAVLFRSKFPPTVHLSDVLS